MPLCTPTLIGSISEWSSTLLVESCVPGATVTVESIGPSVRTVAKTAGVGGGRDRIHLLAAEKLRADDLLVLSQESAAGLSPKTDKRLAFPIGSAPTDSGSLPPLSFVSHIYECGQAVGWRRRTRCVRNHPGSRHNCPRTLYRRPSPAHQYRPDALRGRFDLYLASRSRRLAAVGRRATTPNLPGLQN
jgi:hypothetical protein